jgi:recombination protein RecT
MAQNTAVVQKIDAFKGILNNQTIRAQLKNSLKENAGAFMSSMIDLYSSDTTLQNCDPEKVALECIKAASLKLPINKALGFAYVVPYKGVPTFTIGYKGLIQLAMRTGQYRTINADAVYEGEFVGGDKLTGEIDLSGERTSDKVIGYFAYIQLINGFEKTLYMSKAEVEEWAKKYSPSYKSDYSPWHTEFDKMACKTAIRRLIGTYGAMSMEMQNVISEDDIETKVKRDVASNANIIEIDANTGEVKAEPAPTQIPQNTQAPEDIPPAGF